LSFLRALLGAIVISKGKILIQGYLLKSFSISFFYSMSVTVILVFFFRFFLFGIGLVIDNELAFRFLPEIYICGALGLIFLIELRTNQTYLAKRHSRKLINRTTFLTNLLSVVLLIAYVYLS
jgi:hypothetical protein